MSGFARFPTVLRVLLLEGNNRGFGGENQISRHSIFMRFFNREEEQDDEQQQPYVQVVDLQIEQNDIKRRMLELYLLSLSAR
jgi:hypothetical protein